MKGLRLSPALARTASAFAIATSLSIPALAETASPNPGAEAANSPASDEVVAKTTVSSSRR